MSVWSRYEFAIYAAFFAGVIGTFHIYEQMKSQSRQEPRVFHSKNRKFRRYTGFEFINGIEITVRGTLTFISAIPPSYTVEQLDDAIDNFFIETFSGEENDVILISHRMNSATVVKRQNTDVLFTLLCQNERFIHDLSISDRTFNVAFGIDLYIDLQSAKRREFGELQGRPFDN
eukprot:194502_1